jgi:hypothetical protein
MNINTTINLDDILNSNEEASSEETIEILKESITETAKSIEENASLPDFDAIVTEWSYRCDKGYPDMNNKSDIIKLQEILNEMGVKSPFKRITELTPAEKKAAEAKKAKSTATSTFTTANKAAAIERMSNVILKSGISRTAAEQMIDKLKTMTPKEVQPIAEKFQTLSVDKFFNRGWETFKEFWPIKGDKVGTGRGELMAVMAIKGAKSGGTGMKDLQLADGTQWEVKEDPYSIRMAKSGFSGLFEYVDEMRTFYKYLVGLNLNDRSKDKQLLIDLKAAFNDDGIANELFTILKVNFRGDGFKASKQDTEAGDYVDTESFFERVKIAAELPASVIQKHYDGFLKLKELRKDLAKNSDLIKTAKMTVKTQDTENDYYISKEDAEELKTAKVDSEVSIHKGKSAKNKDTRVFMFNLLKLFDHPYSITPNKLIVGIQKQKMEYFGEVVGVLYYKKGKEQPYSGKLSEFVIFGISQGQGKMSLRDKYDNKGYVWIDKQK